MIGIITHYDVHNHGALLQLYALIHVLRKDFNQESKALQFSKNYDYIPREDQGKYVLSISSVQPYLRYLKDRGLSAFIYNFKKKLTLNRFKQETGIVGDFYTDCGFLEAVIIGSDEVFALHTGITPAFWGIGLPSEYVFSYAGSFGPTTLADLDSLQVRSFVADALSRINGLSVRDENSALLCRTLTGIAPEIVLDPVLLYGYKEELSEAVERPLDKPYLLIYAYDQRMNDRKEVEAIRSYARENGLEVVSPGFYHRWVDHNINVDPIGLLAWFKHATAVVTDTFHGAVLSFISHARPAVIVRSSNSNKLRSLLREFDCEERIVEEGSTTIDQVLSIPVDYRIVDRIIGDKRTKSMSFLRRQLELAHVI